MHSLVETPCLGTRSIEIGTQAVDGEVVFDLLIADAILQRLAPMLLFHEHVLDLTNLIVLSIHLLAPCRVVHGFECDERASVDSLLPLLGSHALPHMRWHDERLDGTERETLGNLDLL